MTANTKTTWQKLLIKLSGILYAPVYAKKQKADIGDPQEGEHFITVDQSFLNDFLIDAKDGRRWCDEAAMHWAEILTFPFSKMIITFNLGVLAFIGVLHESFFSQSILLLSVIFALASLFVLTIFTRSVIVKNINSLANRKRILNYTVTHAPSQGVRNHEEDQNVLPLMEQQARALKECLDGLDDHVRIWMPWQKIGIYLFYASIFSVLIGIILDI